MPTHGTVKTSKCSVDCSLSGNKITLSRSLIETMFTVTAAMCVCIYQKQSDQHVQRRTVAIYPFNSSIARLQPHRLLTSPW